MLQTNFRRLGARLFVLGALLVCLVTVTGKHSANAALSTCDPELRYICQTSDDGIWYESCCVCAQRAVVETCENQLSYHYYACTDECLPYY
ncbi:MAG TPA: hypothetical protein VK582_21985 [Pyrinomonadaceae bacterium]|nr:hypothetical protein [Pyrinomonadaceae bacterium]